MCSWFSDLSWFWLRSTLEALFRFLNVWFEDWACCHGWVPLCHTFKETIFSVNIAIQHLHMSQTIKIVTDASFQSWDFIFRWINSRKKIFTATDFHRKSDFFQNAISQKGPIKRFSFCIFWDPQTMCFHTQVSKYGGQFVYLSSPSGQLWKDDFKAWLIKQIQFLHIAECFLTKTQFVLFVLFGKVSPDEGKRAGLAGIYPCP